MTFLPWTPALTSLSASSEVCVLSGIEVGGVIDGLDAFTLLVARMIEVADHHVCLSESLNLAFRVLISLDAA